MNSRVAIYKRIGDLLDGCKGCPKNWGYSSPKVRCKDCKAYREMRRLGDALIKDESRRLKLEAMLTVAEYKEMRQTMKTDSKICLETGIERADLREWKKQHADELTDIPMSGPKAGSKPSPNAKLGKKLSDELKAAKAEISRLKKKLEDQEKTERESAGITDAEFNGMKDKLLASISELTNTEICRTLHVGHTRVFNTRVGYDLYQSRSKLTKYEIYRGENLVARGTAARCAEKLKVTPGYICWLTTDAARKHIEKKKCPEECLIGFFREVNEAVAE